MQSDVSDDIDEARHDFFELHKLNNRAHEVMTKIRQIVTRAEEPAANADVANDPINAAHINNVVAAAPDNDDLRAPVSAAVQRPQRKCSKCGSCTHQSNSRKCPHNNAIPDI